MTGMMAALTIVGSAFGTPGSPGGPPGSGGPLSVSVEPNQATGYWEPPEPPSFPGLGVTEFVAALISGGVNPLSYAWSYVSGDVGLFIAPTSVAQTVQWSFNGSGYREAVWKCVVTDGVGHTAEDTVAVIANPTLVI